MGATTRTQPAATPRQSTGGAYIRQAPVPVPVPVPVPDGVRQAVVDGYAELARREPGAGRFVSVRSSATVEDSAQLSFAGMFESYLNLRGEDEVLRRVKDCWASDCSWRSGRQLPGARCERPPTRVKRHRVTSAARAATPITLDR